MNEDKVAVLGLLMMRSQTRLPTAKKYFTDDVVAAIPSIHLKYMCNCKETTKIGENWDAVAAMSM